MVEKKKKPNAKKSSETKPKTDTMPGVQIDSGYDPSIGKPAYWKDREEARYTDRAAENFEKRDWFESMGPQQKEDYLARFRTHGSR